MKAPTEDGYSVIWHAVLPWYCHATGASPSGARALMGKLARDHGRAAILTAFDNVLEAKPRPIDPGPYFIKLVKEGNGNAKPSAVERAHADIRNRRGLS